VAWALSFWGQSLGQGLSGGPVPGGSEAWAGVLGTWALESRSGGHPRLGGASGSLADGHSDEAAGTQGVWSLQPSPSYATRS
jgi:hypothetical protein